MNKLKDMFTLNKKVIVITGAAGLLGRKHAEAVLAFGGVPVLLDINSTALNDLKDDLMKVYDTDLMSAVVDITNEKNIEKNCKTIIKKYGKIDGLILNAANNPKIEETEKTNFSRLENFSCKTWESDVDVGLKGSFLCVKHYGKEISENPLGGSIIAISSDLGMIGPDQRLYEKSGIPEHLQSVKPITYSVVKTGLIGLVRYLATYWAKKGVRVNAICPGGIENNQPEDFIEELITRIPLGRMAKIDDYQGIIVWMLSDASSYLNGAVIPIDGGRTAW